MLHAIKQYIPKPLLQVYHLALARLAAVLYGHPSERLVVIGVTGTNGKSSTTQFIAQLLTELGETVGYTTTAGFSIAGKPIENAMKMTMPGRFYLQKLVKHMADVGCTYVVVETSSQGIAQYRHLGLNYDVAVFTNLTPEHIEAHGGFQAYKRAKGTLFDHLTDKPNKYIGGKQIPKVSVVNTEDEHAEYFAAFSADRHVSFAFKNTTHDDEVGPDILSEQLPLKAEYQKKNALAAAATVYALGFNTKDVRRATAGLVPLPGRFEFVDLGQDFHVIVDYAYEPYAIRALLESVRELQPKRIIGVHGSAGGGRDVGRRYHIGKLAAEEEDVVVVTNEDPYDEDPRNIIEDVARGARDHGKEDGKNLFLVDDRAEGIQKAINEAKKGDVVLLTAKGSEPVMAVAGGKKIPWSDRKAAIDALNKRGYATT